MLKGNNYICFQKNYTMKFKLFFSTFSLVFTLSLQYGQTVLINENFNSGILNGWMFFDGDMASPFNDPQVAQLPNSFHLVADYDSLSTGDSVLAATSWFNNTTAASNFLVSPVINFSSNGNYLNFQAMSVDGSYPDGLQIFYSYNNTNMDSLMINPLLFDTIAVPSVCTDFQVKLDDVPLNVDLYIVFRHYATNQYILAIDNINVVTNDLTGFPENIKNQISIYPNPSSGKIIIEGKNNDDVIIHNALGKMIWKGIIKESTELNFSKGFYILNSKGESHSFIIK